MCAEMSTAGVEGIQVTLWKGLFPLMRPLFRRNMGLDRHNVARARARLSGFFDRLEAEVQPSGYLVGDTFSIADLTAAAVMTAIIRPPEFSYALPDPWPESLTTLRQSVAHRAGFAWVLDIYARHRGASYEIDDDPASRV
jgi:glutathione S-transferase